MISSRFIAGSTIKGRDCAGEAQIDVDAARTCIHAGSTTHCAAWRNTISEARVSAAIILSMTGHADFIKYYAVMMMMSTLY